MALSKKGQKKIEGTKLQEQANESAAKGDFLNASYYAISALNSFSQAEDSEGIKACKKLTSEYNKKAEAQMVSHTISIPMGEKLTDELKRIINNLTKSDSVEENLLSISRASYLVPSFADAQRNAKNIVPVTAQLVTSINYGDDGNLNSFDDFSGDWLIDNYGFGMDFSMMALNLIFSELISKGQFTEDGIMDILLAKKIFDADYLLKFQAVLKRYFAGDFLSSIHLLVPLIEKTFMTLSGLLGLDVITFNGEKMSTRNKTLASNMLYSPEYQKVWGKDFCIMLDFFLLNARAHRFRHKVAHGDIRVADCNFTSFNVLFFFIIRMILLIHVEEKSE